MKMLWIFYFELSDIPQIIMENNVFSNEYFFSKIYGEALNYFSLSQYFSTTVRWKK